MRVMTSHSLRADEIKLWLTNQSLVIVCTQAREFLRMEIVKCSYFWRLPSSPRINEDDDR